MRSEQIQGLSSFAATMTNSKYISQKKKMETGLKFFRNYFNYGKMSEFLNEKEVKQ